VECILPIISVSGLVSTFNEFADSICGGQILPGVCNISGIKSARLIGTARCLGI